MRNRVTLTLNDTEASWVMFGYNTRRGTGHPPIDHPRNYVRWLCQQHTSSVGDHPAEAPRPEGRRDITVSFTPTPATASDLDEIGLHWNKAQYIRNLIYADYLILGGAP